METVSAISDDIDSIIESLHPPSSTMSIMQSPLTEGQIHEFKDLIANSQVPDLELQLAMLFELGDYQFSLKSGAILDYYVAALCFSHEHHLSTNETVQFVNLAKHLLDHAQTGATQEQNLMLFRQSLVSDGGFRESFRECKMKPMIDFVAGTFYQHYLMYTCLFQEEQEEQVIEHKLFLNVAPESSVPYPPPLEESLSEGWYDSFMCPAAGVPVEEKQDEEAISEEAASESNLDSNGVGAIIDELTADQVLASIDKEEIKKMIVTAAEKQLESLKIEMEGKVKEKESNMLKKLGN